MSKKTGIEEVNDIMVENGCSMIEAMHIQKREKLLQEIDSSQDLLSCEGKCDKILDILLDVVHHMMFR